MATSTSLKDQAASLEAQILTERRRLQTVQTGGAGSDLATLRSLEAQLIDVQRAMCGPATLAATLGLT